MEFLLVTLSLFLGALIVVHLGVSIADKAAARIAAYMASLELGKWD